MLGRTTRHLTLLIFISALISFLWFRFAKIIATGESGLFFYRPSIIHHKISSYWVEFGTGIPQAAFVVGAPFRSFLIFFQRVFPDWLIQGLVYFLLLTTGLWGSYFFATLVCRKRGLAPIFTSFFYLFNLFVFTQVWNRMLIAHFFAWAYFSWFLWLSVLLLSTKKKEQFFKLLFVLILSSLVFSYIFVQVVFLITLWVPVVLYWFVARIIPLFSNKSLSRILVELFKLLLFLLSWLVANIWWLYPNWVISRFTFYETFSRDYNFNSLIGISRGIQPSDIPTLWHGLFLGEQTPWGWFYQAGGVLYGLRWVPFILLVIGVFSFLKNKNFFSLFFLLIAGWFVSKGTNPPLGYVFYKFLFYNFPFTAVLRNPYEKFGLVFVLPYSIFFALGLNRLYEKLKPKIREFVVSGILILSCGVLVWPMWTGYIYKDRRVKVPTYYKEADEFLEQFGGDGRILMLPLIPGDGVKMKWDYRGIEPSEFLFSRSTISKILRTRYYDDVYWNLYQDLNERMIIDSDKLRNLNVSFVILRKDLEGGLSDKGLSIEGVKEVVLQNSDLEYLATFGDLEIYSFEPNKQGLIFDVDSDEEISFSYQKLSPTRYRVYIRGVNQPFNLIFKSTYNDLWEARIDGKKIDKHFLAYGYANGWRVDEGGDYSVDVVFKVWLWE